MKADEKSDEIRCRWLVVLYIRENLVWKVQDRDRNSSKEIVKYATLMSVYPLLGWT